MEKDFNELMHRCPIDGHQLPGKWACWMRSHGRQRRLHGALLDSSILDWLEQFHSDPATRAK